MGRTRELAQGVLHRWDFWPHDVLSVIQDTLNRGINFAL
jgi:hypothetical protein